ncbi:MAG: family 16 glycosylhydrolase [Chitinophagaceae bacterium]
MKIIKNLITLFAVLCLLDSCQKDSNNNNIVSPTNLTLTAIVAADSSGQVNFTANAANATSYEFDFGNGITEASISGLVTYRYQIANDYTVKVIAKNAGSNTISKSIQIKVVLTKAVWSDEFDYVGAPNPNKWTYDIGNNNGWGNGEKQYYTANPQNVKVENGVLKITAIKENYNGFSYTSARIKSQGKFDFKYGKVEVRAKLPVGGGTWPAIWMLGSNITSVGWPSCGEIDIMEHVGNDLNKIHGTLHYPARFGGNGNSGTIMITNATTAFHKYSVDWSATSIRFYVDDQLFHTVANSNAIPFNHDFFMILNCAMGGAFGGNIDPNFATSALEIDYIRVYNN